MSVLCPGFVNTRIFESDRNMPDHVRAALAIDPRPPTRSSARWSDSGIPPADAADAVFAAISENRFFVLPHQRAALRYVENRLVWMQGGEPAAFDIESLIRP